MWGQVFSDLEMSLSALPPCALKNIKLLKNNIFCLLTSVPYCFEDFHFHVSTIKGDLHIKVCSQVSGNTTAHVKRLCNDVGVELSAPCWLHCYGLNCHRKHHNMETIFCWGVNGLVSQGLCLCNKGIMVIHFKLCVWPPMSCSSAFGLHQLISSLGQPVCPSAMCVYIYVQISPDCEDFPLLYIKRLNWIYTYIQWI